VDRIIKFEAAAGSGKTYQLTFEYLKQVIHLFNSALQSNRTSDDTERLICSILAITFTNKAANEMKERIIGKLKRFSLSSRQVPLDPTDQELLENLSRELNLDEDRIIRLSGLIIERIISHYHDFNVKTIDSLMSSIIKVISPDLNLPPDFEIGLDATEELRQRTVEFIETICQRNWEFFQSVLINIKNSETLRQWNLDERIIEYLLKFFIMAQHHGIEDSTAPDDVSERLFGAFDVLKGSMSGLLSLIQSHSGPDEIHPGLNKAVVNPSLVSALTDFVEDGRNPQKIDPVLKKTMFTQEDGAACLKKNSDKDFRDMFTEQFRKTRGHLSDFILLLSLNRVSHFSQFFSDFLHFWEDNRQLIFVNEFSRTLRRKFEVWENSALPYIYLKLSDRFRHFLFDEFQDTSELQFTALVPILEEVLVSDERSSIFIVGDRKQAIYRWRGGNAELMDENRLRDELSALNWLAPEQTFTRKLDKNYRSGKSIVNFNNLFWNTGKLKQMLSSLGTSDLLSDNIRSNFETADQDISAYGSENEGFVQVSGLEYPDSETAGSMTAQSRLYDRCEHMIRRLFARGYHGSDIAILIRSNEEGRDMVGFLESRQIKTISDESLLLSSSSLIREIIAFFRFIDYPPDHLNLYTFITGDIFRRRAIDLFPAEMEIFDETSLTEISTGKPFYKRCKELVPEIWQHLIDPFVRQAGFSPPYDVFQDLILKFRLFENFPDSSSFFLTFGSILHDLEQKDINSIAALVAEWEKNIRSKNPFTINVSDDMTRVRVMTIHKAKGLEFPIVIIPLRWKSPGGGNNLFWWRGNFYHISKDYARINSHLGNLYRDEIEKGFIDELNLLYVALTRARDGLFIPFVYRQRRQSSRQDPFRRFSRFAEIMANHPCIRDNLKPAPQSGDSDSWMEYSWGEWPGKGSDSSPSDPMPKPLHIESKRIGTAEWQKEFLVFSAIDRIGIDDVDSMERGNAIHRLLSRIERIQDKNQIDEMIRELSETEDLTESDGRRLGRFLAREDVFAFFNGHFEVFNEREIAGYIGDRIEYRRVDRLLLTPERVLVIDYKTGSQKSDHHSRQVMDYIQILRPIFPEKNLEGYLLYPDLDLLEQVKC
jgi:ATP-dependent helicase/nuclease subunit A